MDQLQEAYKKAMSFAASRHNDQLLPGTQLPYLVHLTNVAMEIMVAGFKTADFNLPYAIRIALLHDILEDTTTSYNEIKEEFDPETAEAVLALTKFPNLPKAERIRDSLRRIKDLPKEVWAVKLADRITNLQAPPLAWDYKKRRHYMGDAELIHQELSDGNSYLAERLSLKIVEYQRFVYIGEK